MVWIFDSNSYFVDPSMADDTGDGLTELTAKQTLAAVIGLTPPAGSTIFLAGGTHTVTSATVVLIPDGVNFVGGGYEVTTIECDPEDPNEEFLRLNGTNKFEGINLRGALTGDGMIFNSTTSGVAIDLTLENCRLAATDELLELALQTIGTHQIRVKNCVLTSGGKASFNLGGYAAEITFEDCLTDVMNSL